MFPLVDSNWIMRTSTDIGYLHYTIKVDKSGTEVPHTRDAKKNFGKKRRKKDWARGCNYNAFARWLSMNTNREYIRIGCAYIRGSVFLVSAYAKPVSHGWCSQSPGPWIMHAIFVRAKRNVRSRVSIRICMYTSVQESVCIYVQYVYMRIYFGESADETARLLGWFIRGGPSALKRRAVARSNPTSKRLRGDRSVSCRLSRDTKKRYACESCVNCRINCVLLHGVIFSSTNTVLRQQRRSARLYYKAFRAAVGILINAFVVDCRIF